MTEAEIRGEFPGVENVAYFNAAAASLLPRCVAEAVAAVTRRQCERGILSWPDDTRAVRGAREAAAGLIGAAPDDVAFVSNTAEGIAKVAEGLDWKDGDEVVLGDLEYPANVYPWAVQRDRGARLRVVRSEGGRLPAERLLAAVTSQTRVLAVSMVQFSSGYRVDLPVLGEACRRRGILLVVDAIQALPVFPADVKALGIGALAVDGRKWLMGPAGAGFLYVAPEWIERVRPRAAGALSVRGAGEMLQYVRHLDASGQLDLAPMYRAGAGRYEAGYYNVVGIAGLGAALDLAERIGRGTIRSRVESAVSRLAAGLEERGFTLFGPVEPEERSGIVAFDVPGSPDDWWRRLEARGFSVAAREGRLRVAPHVYNTLDEIDGLLSALSEIRYSAQT